MRKPANAYTRFIPREELARASWRPGSFGNAGVNHGTGATPADRASAAAHAAATAAAPEPTAAEWHARVVPHATYKAGRYQDGYRDGLAAPRTSSSSSPRRPQPRWHATRRLDRQLAAMDEQLADTPGARTALQLAREVVRSELVTRPALVARVAPKRSAR
ncbi:MAG: hypothetical protein U1F25_10275 [Rubrivivax sp.]